MVRRVLMIAYHFPPVGTSSGVQRTLAFSRYLPENGWQPLVLSVHPRAYARCSDDLLHDVSRNLVVRRAFALDTARHLSIGGQYNRIMAVPDRWATWWFGAVVSGLRLIRRYRPHVIWSTYPIATAHMIGLTLQRLSGLPWIADYRDPMVQEGYPADPLVYRSFEWIERRTVRRSRRVVFTTPGAIEMYASRYPERSADTWVLIENGYDERYFENLEASNRTDRGHAPLRLIHTGLVYSSERDPRALFDALAQLRRKKILTAAELKIVFRGSGSDSYFQRLINDREIEDIVQIMPRISYRKALAEMFSADGLVVLQGSNCNDQIPAKVYEYLRAKRPILALTDPSGDTAKLIRRAGIDTIASLDSPSDIARALQNFISLVKSGKAPIATDEETLRHSRRSNTAILAALLDEVSGGSPVDARESVQREEPTGLPNSRDSGD